MSTDQVTLFDGRFLRLVRRGHWEFVQRIGVSGVVGIIAVTPDGKLILVEQFRPPLGRRVVEIPAGLAGDLSSAPTEELAAAAIRELEEETGWRASAMQPVASGATSAGLCDELVTLFRATGLVKVGPGGGDHAEDIEVHEIPLDEVLPFLSSRQSAGAVIDLKVYSALYVAQQ